MRTISGAQSTVLSGSTRSEHVRVEVKDSGGTFRDLASYWGFDTLESVSWGEGLDEPHATAEVTILPENGTYTIQPLTTAGAALGAIDLNREIRISVALMAALATPSGGDWFPVFQGTIWQIDLSNGAYVAIKARDLGGRLQDLWMEKEHIHGYAVVGGDPFTGGGTPVPVRVFTDNTPFALNEYVVPSQGKVAATPNFYKVTTAGTTASGDASEPAWTAVGTFTSGSVTFTYQDSLWLAGVKMEQLLQSILDANNSGVTLYTPTSPSVTMKPLQVERGAMLEQLRQIAMSIGWDVRYKWDSGTSAFRLTLYQPDRATTTTLRTFAATEYAALDELSLDLANVRTGGTCFYSDASDLWPDGTPKRKAVTQTNATAETKYGRRWAELGEASSSPIDTTTEAQKLIDAFVADCSEPGVVARYAFVHGFPFVELNDYYKFTADGRHYSADQSLAVFEYRHQAQNGFLKTTIGCRGKPSIGFGRWEVITGRVNPTDLHRETRFQSSSGPTLTTSSVVGGTKISINETFQRYAIQPEYEVHIGTSSTFTPSASTLVDTVTKDAVAPNLIPGGNYWARVVPRMWNGARPVRGLPSGATSFTAGRGGAGHLEGIVNWSRRPLNGGFETTYVGPVSGVDEAAHWTPSAGSWGAQFYVVAGVSGSEGLNVLRVNQGAGVTATARGADFSVRGGVGYWLRARAKGVSGSNNLAVDVEWVDAGGATGVSAGLLIPAGVTVWNEYATTFLIAPSTAVKARIRLQATGGTAGEWHLDAVEISEIEVAARYSTSANQSFANNTAVTVDFANVGYDTAACVTTGASWRFTAPKDGKYLVAAAITIDDFATPTTSGTTAVLSLYKNGTETVRLDRKPATALEAITQLGGTTQVELFTGDEINVRLFQNTGAARTLETADMANHISISYLYR